MAIPFIKMHGAGNDFVIVDARKNNFAPSAAQIRRVADRHYGVGCDQFILLEAPRRQGADLYMHIYNPDGSAAEACGNATRCVAKLEFNAWKNKVVVIETKAGLLRAVEEGEVITVDMGAARFGWQDIPLSMEADTLALDLKIADLPKAVGVNMGNPHAVFFIDDADKFPVAVYGPQVEHHSLFPQRTNVEFAQIVSRNDIRMRVWERSAGITLACGSAACATLVAAVRRGLTERKVSMQLDGGVLQLEWLDNNHVLMAGPVAFSFSGVLYDSLLGAA